MIALAGQIVAIRLECRDKSIVSREITKIATGNSKCSASDNFNNGSGAGAAASRRDGAVTAASSAGAKAAKIIDASLGISNVTVVAALGYAKLPGRIARQSPSQIISPLAAVATAECAPESGRLPLFGCGGNQAGTDETLQAARMRMQGRPVIERQIDHDQPRSREFFV